MPFSFEKELVKRDSMLGSFQEFFQPLLVEKEHEKEAFLYNGSKFPADMAICYSDNGNPLAVFEWKKNEDPKSHLQGIVRSKILKI